MGESIHSLVWRAAALVVAAVVLHSPASAADLTGTWTTTARDGVSLPCTFVDAVSVQHAAIGYDSLLITQTGNDIAVQLGQAGDRYQGNAYVDANHANLIWGVASSCARDAGGPTNPYAAGSFFFKERAGGSGDSITVQFIGRFNNGALMKCRGRYKRTSSADPATANCP